jgi:phosphoribosylamine--glycine ligase
MKVLVLGKGGRESAIVWKLSQSEIEKEIYVAPGNPFTARFGKNVNIKEDDIEGIVGFAKDEGIDLVFPGGETSIILGVADRLEEEGIRVFAPRSYVAKLEGSKVWAKEFMKKYAIPTADFEYFDKERFDEAVGFCEGARYPMVIKADGPAGGKGSVIVKNFKEAVKTLEEFLLKSKFGKSSEMVVIEKFLKGEEVSLFVISDGNRWEKLAYVRDFKRLYDSDEGPNTGGMGSVAPIVLDGETERLVEETVVKRTFEGLAKEGLRYKGILYFGLIITDDGPFVLEYNVRLGDPETQALLPILDGDLLEAARSASEGRYKFGTLKLKENIYSCCVVVASRGYPDEPEIGKEISGINDAEEFSLVFLSGVEEKGGSFYTAGGRVLSVVGLGKSRVEAKSKAYKGVSKISFEGMHYRRDIGFPASL